jgi:hypothetical protein
MLTAWMVFAVVVAGTCLYGGFTAGLPNNYTNTVARDPNGVYVGDAAKPVYVAGSVTATASDANAALYASQALAQAVTTYKALSPPVAVPLGRRVTEANFFDSAFDPNLSVAVTLPTGTVSVDVWCSEDTLISTDSNATLTSLPLLQDPNAWPAVYAGGLTHRIPCRSSTRMHYRALTTVGELYVTAMKSE